MEFYPRAEQMSAREIAESAVQKFFDETGACNGKELAFNEDMHKLAYDYAWDNFLELEHTLPDFCIVEDFVHSFLLKGI